jgi:DNA-binding SARP family transcriptional activator
MPTNAALVQHGKAAELMGYLLLFRDRPHHREVLCELLWPAVPGARKHLRQALWQLTGLSTPQGRRPPTLLVDPEWVHLNPAADIELDVARLEDAFVRLRHIPGSELEEEQAAVLRDAVQLYHADLLEGWYQDWCIYERERFKAIYLAMLDKLLAFCEAQGRHDDGLAYGERILRHDRAHERTHQRLMRLNYLAGDRTAAIRQFDRCAAALREELGVSPAERTVALYEEIRADKLPGFADSTTISAGRSDAASDPSPAPHCQEAVTPLRRALRTLGDVQALVQESIEAVERL